MKKVALITGASSGIGKELAIIHAEHGGDLVLIARRLEKLEQLKAQLENEHGISVHLIVKDLTKHEAPKEIVEELNENGIIVDYLINNAGFGGLGLFHERDWEDDQAMIQLNVMALTELTRRILPGMVDRNSGRILNVSSTAGIVPGPLQAVYYATKAFVNSFSNAIAEELHDTKITVTALLPGATETEFAETSGMDKTSLFDRNVASARMVAEAGYDGMMIGKLDVIAGISSFQKFQLLISPIMPKKLVLTQIRKLQEVEK
ncbi:MAG: SDR family oxidoreductase [bacterium]|nr:SDR family oxidoreductase [bacterium]